MEKLLLPIITVDMRYDNDDYGGSNGNTNAAINDNISSSGCQAEPRQGTRPRSKNNRQP